MYFKHSNTCHSTLEIFVLEFSFSFNGTPWAFMLALRSNLLPLQNTSFLVDKENTFILLFYFFFTCLLACFRLLLHTTTTHTSAHGERNE